MTTGAEYWHGTNNGYSNRKCRCDECRDAWRTWLKQKRAKRKAERVWFDGALVHPRAVHGKYTSYSNYGCRCSPCTEAWRVYWEELRKGRAS